MDTRELQRSMYERSGRSFAQRLTLAVLAGAWVALAWWLLFGAGLTTGDTVRRACLAAAFTIYYVRILFTEFMFLKRGVGWSEVFTIAPWILFIYVFLAVIGGRNADAFGAAALVGVGLFLLGSWMNSYAEYARHNWKLRPENRGRLYTEGLFRYSRHPNYLGDLISFSGLCLMAGRWIAAVIPVLMLAGFVFVNIPVLDAHLREKYSSDFEAYAQRTRKLIPFVY